MQNLKYLLFFFLSLFIIPVSAQNNAPVAVDDFESTFSGEGGSYFVLNNDSDPDGNSLTIDTVIHNPNNSSSNLLGGFIINYSANKLFYGIDTVYYVVCDDTIPSLCDTGRLFVDVSYRLWMAYKYLDVNMVKARLNANGRDFSEGDFGLQGGSYEIPKGSGTHTIYSSGLWIGGKDAYDSLHFGANIYGSEDEGLYTGPIMDTSAYSFSQDSLWNELWKIDKSEIDYHIANWQSPSYTAPDAILTWPAHGDVGLGQAAFLAPFFDLNGDQVYEPLQGDYPVIRGDQAIYFIRNDQRGTLGEKVRKELEIEIHGMAYAYDSIQNYGLNHTIFVHYEIVNRSANTYTDTYIGMSFDPDIGDSSDDYIECDVKQGSVLAYNGDSIDGTGAPTHYGLFPPAQALVFLKGPRMDADGIDNALGNCDASLNGFGFGDSIIDNEAIGMTHFTYYCIPGVGGCNGLTQGDPETADDYYNFLTSKWKDGTNVTYGGNGHTNNCTSCEPANFMFPNVSDTCNLGTMQIVPGDTSPWNEQNAGNAPNDRRGVASAGPFTFEAGDTIELDIAYVYGRDTINTDPYGSVTLTKSLVDSVESIFYNRILPSDTMSIVGVPLNLYEIGTIKLHPNPAEDYVKIELSNELNVQRYQILDLTGRLLQTGMIDPDGRIGIEKLPHGVFIMHVSDGDHALRAKFVKL